MSTKKKTPKAPTKPKRSQQWNDYFKAAITGLCSAVGLELDHEDHVAITEIAARHAKMAEKIADIATARNA